MIVRTETQKENINKILDLVKSKLLSYRLFDYNDFIAAYKEVIQENISLTNCRALQTIEKNYMLISFALPHGNYTFNCFIEFCKKEMNYKNWE